MYLPFSTCFCHFDPFSMIVTDKKVIVFFPNPVIMFSFRKNKTDIRNLDFWVINCLETYQICNSFNELQLVYLDWNDYLFKQHSAEDFTIITAEGLELNTKCLSHPLEGVLRHIRGFY